MTHSNPHIQKDLDLWHKIKEYDQRASENPVIMLSIEHDVVHGNIASNIAITDMEHTAPLPLDTQTVAHTTKTTANDDTYVEIMNDNTMQPVRVTPTKHVRFKFPKMSRATWIYGLEFVNMTNGPRRKDSLKFFPRSSNKQRKNKC